MGSGSSAIPKEEHFVVIGAGYAGIVLARKLRDAGLKFTVVNERDAFHNCIAAVRATAVKGFANKTLIPLRDVFGNNFKHGRVVAIDKERKVVQLESGEEIQYNVLIMATGTNGPSPYKLTNENTQDAISLLEGVCSKVEKAQRIAVVGGGATGTEQASEIASKFPMKEVTLIASQNKLVSDKTNDKFQKKVNEILTRQNIKVIKGEKVLGLQDIDDSVGPIKLMTDKGTELEVDLVLKCVGIWVNNQAYKDSLSESMDEKGQLKVDEYFKVEGQDKIYAFGDCANYPQKLAYAAGIQAELLFSNFQKMYSNKKMKPWKPEKEIKVAAIVSLGPSSGVGQLNNGTILPEFVIKSLKSKDMTIPKYWKESGLPVPK